MTDYALPHHSHIHQTLTALHVSAFFFLHAPTVSGGDPTSVADSASVLSMAVRAAVRSSIVSNDDTLAPPRRFESIDETTPTTVADPAPMTSMELTSEVAVWVLRLWWAIHMHAGAADANLERSTCSRFSGLRRHAQDLSPAPTFLEAGHRTLTHLVGPLLPPLFEFLFGALGGEFQSIDELQTELELASIILKPCSAGELVHPWYITQPSFSASLLRTHCVST
jgi:hypothetical protein